MALGLVVLMLVGLLVAGGIALLVVLLANKNTRPAGIALLVVGPGVVVIGAMFLLFFARASPSTRPAEATISEAPVSRLLPEPNPKGGVSEPPEKSSGVLPAMGRSLAKAASETGVAKASRSVKDSPSVLAASLRALGRAIAQEGKRPGSGASEEKTLAAKRPPWVDAEPGLVDGDYQMTATVGPFATRQECDDAQPAALQEAASDYVERFLGPDAPRSVRLSPELLAKNVVADVWEEQRTTDFGPDIGRKPMIRRYVLLKFDRRVNEELKQQERNAVVQRRLRAAGVGMAAILGALALAFAYLKIAAR